MRSRYLVYFAILLVVGAIVSGWLLWLGSRLRVEAFYPSPALPNDELYVRVKNLEADEQPRIYIGGTRALLIEVKAIRDDESLVLVRVPAIVGEAPIRVVGRAGTHTADRRLTVMLANTIRYPRDQAYELRNPHGPGQMTGNGVQSVLVIAGVPADIATTFTAGDLAVELQARYASVDEYWRTISRGNVSLQLTVYPQIVALPKTYGEYIREVRFPVARGSPIPYPVDLSGLADQDISMDVTGPDGTVHTLTSSFDWLIPLMANPAAVPWGNVWQVLYTGDMLPFFVDQGTAGISLDMLALSDAEQSLGGDGYRITALNGPAWARLGLGTPQLFDGRGTVDPRLGGDTDLSPAWWQELQTAVDNTGFDRTGYHSTNHVLIGTPTLSGYLRTTELNQYGYLESHSLRASATIGYGWMRLAHDNQWATWAHETGHNLGLGDQYKNNLDQPGEFVNGWTLMAHHFYESHVSAWEKGGRIAEFWDGAGWLPTGATTQASLPSLGGAITRTTFILAPQYDPLPTLPGYADPVVYAATVPLSARHFLVIEGRQDQPAVTPRRFDEELDLLDDDPGNGGVVAYDIRDFAAGGETPNVYRREMILLTPENDALDAGDPAYADPTLGVSIQVLEEIGTGTIRSFRVAVDWGGANPPPGTRYDAHITPWDSQWQSPDIWVDSPLNGYDTYEATTNTADGDPNGAGDTVAVGEINRLKARIRNAGPEDIPAANVTFWVATPAGIGDRGDWQRLDPFAPGPVGPIPAGGSVVTEAVWIPTGSGHTCVKVEVERIEGELEFSNNLAQENFSNFEVRSSSPYRPLEFSFDVINSTAERRQYALRAMRRVPGVGVKLDHAFPLIEPRSRVTVRGILTLNESIPPSSKYDTPLSIVAYYPWHDSEVELGGITLNLLPRITSKINVTYQRVKDRLLAKGTVQGGSQPRPVTLVVHGGKESVLRQYFKGSTDDRGNFTIGAAGKQDEVPVEVYMYAPATGEFASVRSPTVRLD